MFVELALSVNVSQADVALVSLGVEQGVNPLLVVDQIRLVLELFTFNINQTHDHWPQTANLVIKSRKSMIFEGHTTIGAGSELKTQVMDGNVLDQKVLAREILLTMVTSVLAF